MEKNRREFIKTAGVGVLGAGAAALLGSQKVFAASAKGIPKGPVKIAPTVKSAV